ncbi:Unknown protein [Striga hermonthica]|uniref:Protein SHOOT GRAVITROPISM 5 n=1 Tax=Striga hermonthica TaxID=68872 RepID=A0A9N7MHV1_STRHE|nr:Unknown protein [Striga hermonthica]
MEAQEEENQHREMQLLSPPHAKSQPPLDLRLSISVGPRLTKLQDVGPAEALRWEVAEQIRLAAVERAYAERVRELTRREMEAAHNEFARARAMWERAREEVELVNRMKDRAAREVEVTCQSCRQKFSP